MRKMCAVFAAAAVLLVLAVAPCVHAAATEKGEVVMKVGSKVHLFHSGTPDVKKEICVNDVLPVYREIMGGGHTTTKEVGKVKVVGYDGEHYFWGNVVSGEVKVGDIAKKESGAACLVQRYRGKK